MKLTLILVAGLVLATLGFTIAPLAAHAQGVYIVQAGDTAWGIAARYCMSLQELGSLNGWDNTKINQIYPGVQVQVINRCGGGDWHGGGGGNCGWGGGYDRGRLPHAAGAYYGNTYIVAYGDTSFSIAQRFGISVNALAQANRIDPWHIYAGQRLFIPSGGGHCLPPPSCYPYNECQPSCYGSWCQPSCYGYGCPYYGQPPIYTIPVTPAP